jgi:glutamine---fructose-6-phosphate transaminase (isomerizing)
VVIALGEECDATLERLVDCWIPLPRVSWQLSPIPYTIPLQLLAYEIALLRGCDIDQPRNLAKSVTVE